MGDSNGSSAPGETPQTHRAEEDPGSPVEGECLQRKSTGKIKKLK